MSSSGPKSSVMGRQPWGYTISDIFNYDRDSILLKYHPHSEIKTLYYHIIVYFNNKYFNDNKIIHFCYQNFIPLL